MKTLFQLVLLAALGFGWALPAQAQNECGLNATAVRGTNGTDSSGVNHQNMCVDDITGRVFYPLIQSLIIKNSFGVGLDDLSLGIINRHRYVCNISSNYRFQTIAAGISDVVNNSPNGGMVETCPGHAETITTQIDIGTATTPVALYLGPDTRITCNVTSGSSSACFFIHTGSALVGYNNGGVGSNPPRHGAAYINLACTANVGYVVSTFEGLTQQQGFGYMSHVFIEGCTTGTVGAGSPSVAMVNIEGISSMNEWDNFQVFQFANTVGIRMAANHTVGNAVLGPLICTNCWSDGNAHTGAQPWKIIANGASVLPITINGGVANNPGAGLPAFEANGNATTAFSGLSVHGFYLEKTVGIASIMFKMVDVNNVFIDTTWVNAMDVDTAFDISETAAGRTTNIHLHGKVNSPTQTIVALNNHITGETSPANTVVIPAYNYAGETNISPSLPFTVSFNEFDVTNAAGKKQFKVDPVTGRIIYNNQQDVGGQFQVSSGLTGTQAMDLFLGDQGVNKYSLQKDASNNFNIIDVVNSNLVRFQLQPAGTTFLNSFVTNPIRFNATTNSGTGGVQFFSGGASPSIVGSVDSTGKGTFNAGVISSTFANLPAATNGTIYGCSDCLPGSNPCTGVSTGALAVRQNGAWVCK